MSFWSLTVIALLCSVSSVYSYRGDDKSVRLAGRFPTLYSLTLSLRPGQEAPLLPSPGRITRTQSLPAHLDHNDPRISHLHQLLLGPRRSALQHLAELPHLREPTLAVLRQNVRSSSIAVARLLDQHRRAVEAPLRNRLRACPSIHTPVPPRGASRLVMDMLLDLEGHVTRAHPEWYVARKRSRPIRAALRLAMADLRRDVGALVRVAGPGAEMTSGRNAWLLARVGEVEGFEAWVQEFAVAQSILSKRRYQHELLMRGPRMPASFLPRSLRQ